MTVLFEKWVNLIPSRFLPFISEILTPKIRYFEVKIFEHHSDNLECNRIVEVNNFLEEGSMKTKYHKKTIAIYERTFSGLIFEDAHHYAKILNSCCLQ